MENRKRKCGAEKSRINEKKALETDADKCSKLSTFFLKKLNKRSRRGRALQQQPSLVQFAANSEEQGPVTLPSSSHEPNTAAWADIDECSEGLVQCDTHSTCVNLPGWYHCECREGYHDNEVYTANGEACKDVDECVTGLSTCANDTLCFNLDGGYDCRCRHAHNCTGDCVHHGQVKHSGQIWVLDTDRCSICSCQAGRVQCRRGVCDCDSPSVDLFCCPECDLRLTSQCVHQSGLLTFSSGDTWIHSCQRCQCQQGEVDCWPVSCPPLDCVFTLLPEGECCPRCVSDPCQTHTVLNDISRTCEDEHGITRFSGSTWIKHSTDCTLCQCKSGHICCSVDPMCL